MKKFFLLLAAGVCAQFSTMAQPSMTITNHTTCPVTYLLVASTPSPCYPSPAGMGTGYVSLAGSSSVSYPRISALNGCGPGAHWIGSCNACTANPPCKCVMPADPGVWEWADVSTSSTPAATYLGMGGAPMGHGVAGQCNGVPINVTWNKNLATGDVTLDYN